MKLPFITDPATMWLQRDVLELALFSRDENFKQLVRQRFARDHYDMTLHRNCLMSDVVAGLRGRLDGPYSDWLMIGAWEECRLDAEELRLCFILEQIFLFLHQEMVRPMSVALIIEGGGFSFSVSACRKAQLVALLTSADSDNIGYTDLFVLFFTALLKEWNGRYEIEEEGETTTFRLFINSRPYTVVDIEARIAMIESGDYKDFP